MITRRTGNKINITLVLGKNRAFRKRELNSVSRVKGSLIMKEF